MLEQTIISVVEASQVAEARRAGSKLAESMAWDATSAGKLSIVITEVATNLVKFAKQGEVHLRTHDQLGSRGIEVMAFDRGPGIDRVDACLVDGYSTASTSGTGLGAIARLADEFDIYSQPDMGTCLVARLFSGLGKRPSLRAPFIFGVARVPAPGESECGDDWGVRVDQGRTVVVLADGLGHGPDAAEASREAVAVLEKATDLAPAAVLEKIHIALRSTRGAAVAVAQIDAEKEQIIFAGAGNISAMIVTEGANMVSLHNAKPLANILNAIKSFIPGLRRRHW